VGYGHGSGFATNFGQATDGGISEIGQEDLQGGKFRLQLERVRTLNVAKRVNLRGRGWLAVDRTRIAVWLFLEPVMLAAVILAGPDGTPFSDRGVVRIENSL
jgi:hypothetical protein